MKHILLDLGGVVFQSVGRSNARINWPVITALNVQYGHQLNLGEDVFPAFLAAYNEQTSQSLSGPAFLESVFDTLEINQPLLDFLQPLGPIYILSDNYRENIEYIAERYRFGDWAVEQFYSYGFGRTKEDPELFRQVVQRMDVPLKELIFIDDSPRKLAVARTCGIRSIQFRDNAQLFRELKPLLTS